MIILITYLNNYGNSTKKFNCLIKNKTINCNLFLLNLWAKMLAVKIVEEIFDGGRGCQ
jgi:hypothetical protein